MMAKKRQYKTTNLVVVSDIHAGCGYAMSPKDGFPRDNETVVYPSKTVRKVMNMWDEFWGEWVPLITKGEPFDICVNGDLLDGVHHRSTTQISQNLTDQSRIGEAILRPIRDLPRCERFYVIRGTEAHTGPDGQEEEELAKKLGAAPDSEGHYARFELWKNVGEWLVHLAHHIGTTGRAAYESSAPQAELIAMFAEAGRWGKRCPNCVVRSHRHRYIHIENPSSVGSAVAVVTPGWQLKTPFAFKIPGGRVSEPQFGGIIIRQGDETAHMRHKVWAIDRSPEED